MLLIFLGGVLLFLGAEALVRASASLATRVGISPVVAGLTVVAFGTSAPELSVSVSSALEGHAGLALGNVVGSNVFNIAVILGLAAIIRPLQVHSGVIRRDIPVMIVCALAAIVLMAVVGFTRTVGLGLVSGLIVYLVVTVRSAKNHPEVKVEGAEAMSVLTKHWALELLILAGGLALLVLGSRIFVDGAMVLAKSFGVSDAVIGLTIVAAGTSLPELATSVVAAIRGQSDIAIGNVVGSNIFNVLCILGITALVTPFDAVGVGMRDGLLMLFLSLILLPFALTHSKLSRAEGLILVAVYGGYLFLLWPR